MSEAAEYLAVPWRIAATTSSRHFATDDVGSYASSMRFRYSMEYRLRSASRPVSGCQKWRVFLPYSHTESRKEQKDLITLTVSWWFSTTMNSTSSVLALSARSRQIPTDHRSYFWHTRVLDEREIALERLHEQRGVARLDGQTRLDELEHALVRHVHAVLVYASHASSTRTVDGQHLNECDHIEKELRVESGVARDGDQRLHDVADQHLSAQRFYSHHRNDLRHT